MKLTLWNQFSSNHSASFFLVGQFESVEWAEMVADELRLMLYNIGAWWEQITQNNSEDQHRIMNELLRQKRSSPPEEKYQQQYQVEWAHHYITRKPVPLDWVYYRKTANYVRTYQNLVILDPANDTWLGPQPFRDIMVKLGGVVGANCEVYDSYLSIRLTCQAPDEATAEKIIASVQPIRPDRHYIKIGSLYPTMAVVTRDGPHITIKHFHLRAEVDMADMRGHGKMRPEIMLSFEEQLEALLNFLREHGCTSIEYKITETRYDKLD